MPHIIEKTVFNFDELNDSAKERAREWWRGCESQDFDHSAIYDDAKECGELIGVTIDSKAVNLVGGGTRYDPTIYYNGFSSQGDGACFEGWYSYAKGAAKAISAHTGKSDKELISIAQRLQKIQSRNFYKLSARMKHSGHYYHSGCMRVEVEYDGSDATREADDEITQCMRDFADWIYRNLEREYEYRMSDENVDESIRINEYEFDEEGRLAR